jgi:hypothetical protein
LSFNILVLYLDFRWQFIYTGKYIYIYI